MGKRKTKSQFKSDFQCNAKTTKGKSNPFFSREQKTKNGNRI